MNVWSRFGLAVTLCTALCIGGLFAQKPGAHPQPMVAKAQNQGEQRGSTTPAAQMSVVVVPVPVYEVAASDVSAHPEKYYGNLVSVTSKVEDILGSNMFTLSGERLLPPRLDLLVILPRPIKVTKGQRLHVIGHLRPLIEAALARDYNWLKLSWFREADLKIQLKEQPVIIAASVQTADGKELLPQAK